VIEQQEAGIVAILKDERQDTLLRRIQPKIGPASTAEVCHAPAPESVPAEQVQNTTDSRTCRFGCVNGFETLSELRRQRSGRASPDRCP